MLGIYRDYCYAIALGFQSFPPTLQPRLHTGLFLPHGAVLPSSVFPAPLAVPFMLSFIQQLPYVKINEECHGIVSGKLLKLEFFVNCAWRAMSAVGTNFSCSPLVVYPLTEDFSPPLTAALLVDFLLLKLYGTHVLSHKGLLYSRG